MAHPEEPTLPEEIPVQRKNKNINNVLHDISRFLLSEIQRRAFLSPRSVKQYKCNLRWPAATDALLSGHPLGGRSGHREMAPGSRFPILQAADLGLMRTVKCFVARFKMALAETSSFRIIALKLFGSR